MPGGKAAKVLKFADPLLRFLVIFSTVIYLADIYHKEKERILAMKRADKKFGPKYGL